MTVNAERIWQTVLGELQLEMTRATFETWLRETRLVAHEDGCFVIGTANAYARDWLEQRLRSVIVRALTRHAGRSAQVRFVVYEPPPSSQPEPLALPLDKAVRPNGNGALSLNPNYRFETFVVGPGNRLAHAACQAVAEQPARTFNPLFLYGGVGLGKTHLMHAIAHVTHLAGLRVVYVSAETFTNDLIEAIRGHSTEAFREKYRTADVLLVDDIHFIAGKESTQEEFFHTFNALHSNGSQIVVCSDRPPRAMALLEERLRSRFEWGLMVDIQPPELETRIAILKSKASIRGMTVPDEILYLIAERIQSNIRELEGGLNRVLAMTTLTNQPLSAELALEALSDLSACAPAEITTEAIVNAVAAFYNLTLAELTSSSRERRLARARQVAMFLLRQETDASLSQIAALMQRQDHTTVIYACDKVAAMMDEDPSFRREVQAIRERIYQDTPVRQP